jgi:hypothetical protein
MTPSKEKLMARILVEQTFDPPMSDDDYAKLAKRLDPCLDLRHAIWVRSHVAVDKGRMLCEFEAPDAEAVREAMRTAGMPFDRAWLIGTCELAAERRAERSVMVEAEAPAALLSDAVLVRRCRSAEAGKKQLSEYQTRDSETLLAALRSAGARAWLADVFAIEDYPEWMVKLEQVRQRIANMP